MKLFRHVALTTMLTIGAFSAITYVSCTKDACKDVVCQHSGTCADGVCTCPTGYEGTNCETSSASKVTAGVYSASESCNPPVAGGSTWTSNISLSSTEPTNIVITNFGNSDNSATAKVDKNALTLNAFDINGMAVTGSGTIIGGVLTITYTVGNTYTCTQTLTAQ